MNKQQTKTCLQCKKELPVSKFHKESRIKDGYRRYCKLCACEKSKQYYWEHKKAILKREKDKRVKIKKLLALYGELL